MPLVIHFIDFSNRNLWIENQLPLFFEAGIDQALVSISPEGDIHSAVRASGFAQVKGVNRSFRGCLSMFRTLKKWSQDSEVYIYAHGHLPSICASFFTFFLKVDFVICHHQPNPDYFIEFRKRKYIRATVHELLARLYYLRAKRIQVLSSEVELSLRERRIHSDKIVRIPLGLEFSSFFEVENHHTSLQNCKRIKIVSVGRLVWEKRLDLGIRTIANLTQRGFDVDYSIVGAGPEAGALEKLAAALGLEGKVRFHGQLKDINGILNESNLFFHLSISESYGQAIMESRIVNLPIFSSPCGVALDMEELDDPLVKIFRTQDISSIATELLDFISELKVSKPLSAAVDGKQMYSYHESSVAVKATISMFESLSHQDME